MVDRPTFDLVSFAEATFRKELLTPNESKSPGPDDMPPKLLKELTGELSKPLSMLFQASFEAGYLPADWTYARITPHYKGGSKVLANNYRPISLTSIYGVVAVVANDHGEVVAVVVVVLVLVVVVVVMVKEEEEEEEDWKAGRTMPI
ncbi:hypothetical protein SprV_0702312700 [Sparganum proliferum]